MTITGIGNRFSLFDTAPELVTERFTIAEETAGGAYATAMEALNKLSGVAGALTLINRTIGIDTTTISSGEISVRPPTINDSDYYLRIPELPSDPVLSDTTIDAFPSFPDFTGGALTDPGESYISSLLTLMKSKMISDLQSGSTGIPDNVQDAIFNTGVERDILELHDEQDRIRAEWSKCGFPIPTMMMVANQNEAQIKYGDKRLDASRSIVIKSFELALNNYHFILDQGVKLESQLTSYAHSVAALAFQYASAVATNQLEIYKTKTSAVAAQRTSIVEKAKAYIEHNLGLIQAYSAKISGYTANIQGQSALVTAVGKRDETKMGLFSSIANFDIQRIGLDLKVLQMRIEQAIANANILIKDKDIELKNYEVINSLKVEADKAIGQIAAQIAAGAYSGVSASSHIAASDSSSYSYSGPHTIAEIEAIVGPL